MDEKFKPEFSRFSPIQRHFESKVELRDAISGFITAGLLETQGFVIGAIQESINKIFEGNLDYEDEQNEIMSLKNNMNYLTEKIRGEKNSRDFISAVHTIIEKKIPEN